MFSASNSGRGTVTFTTDERGWKEFARWVQTFRESENPDLLEFVRLGRSQDRTKVASQLWLCIAERPPESIDLRSAANGFLSLLRANEHLPVEIIWDDGSESTGGPTSRIWGPSAVTELDAHGEQLLQWLAIKLDEAIPGRPETYVSYKDAHDELRLPLIRGKTYGLSLEQQGQGNIAYWTRDMELPGVTGLIIDWAKKEPGSGYFEVYERNVDEHEWWHEQIRLAKEHNWWQYVSRPTATWAKRSTEQPDVIPDTPLASDLCEPPEWVISTTYRVLRDTAKTKSLKNLHGYMCQICKRVLSLPDGTHYCEVHHIRPLGGGHEGGDNWTNMLCVCPNCHALLDLAAFDLRLGDLRRVEGHVIGVDNIEYHNVALRARWSSS